mmetsp:Transcript_1863/g.3267  ORF Transcript_1863/g.3267 Transcript_1863/m.3267 type:complete len:131 (-) Transcript_1863:63-455(-)
MVSNKDVARTTEQDGPIPVPIVVAKEIQYQPEPKLVLFDEPMRAGDVTQEAIPLGSKRDIRGAGVAGGVVGLVLGGPILAVVGGYMAAWVARKHESPTGDLAREFGGKTANLLDRLRDWIDGNETENSRQ